jgi:hypothetical protein
MPPWDIVPGVGAVVLEDSGAEGWDEQATKILSAIAAKKTLKNFKNRIRLVPMGYENFSIASYSQQSTLVDNNYHQLQTILHDVPRPVKNYSQ